MTIYKIAKLAGVSIATVSRVMNNSPKVTESTRRRVEAVLREAQFTPSAVARSLATNATKTVGLLTSDVRDSYYANASYVIEQTCQAHGYQVILCNTGSEPDKKIAYLQMLLEKQVDGIILVGSGFAEPVLHAAIASAAARVPIVTLNGDLALPGVSAVVCDDRRATADIARYLCGAGRRDVLYLYDAETPSGRAKRQGFRDGMAAGGADDVDDRIMRVAPGILGGLHGVAQATAAGHSFAAIVASDDLIAAGALRQVIALGRRVPDEVAIFGFNNSALCLLTMPELTSVDNKVTASATTAADYLCAVLQGQQVPARTVIAPEIMLRASGNLGHNT
jgi:DNA-binding LacI/PurR family transcriptional regulator